MERGSVAHDVTGRAECAVLLTPLGHRKKDLPT